MKAPYGHEIISQRKLKVKKLRIVESRMAANYFLVGLFFCLLVSLGTTQTEDKVNPYIGKKIAESPSNNGSDTTSTSTSSSTTSTTTVSPTPSPDTTTPVTTETPDTTTPSPKTTTPEPKTTTPDPNTTTPAPKTTTPVPDTTTPKPDTTTSTTTVAPSTTPAPPTPLPEPEMGSWVLNNTAENITCAIIHMALRIKVPYSVGINETQWALFNLPKNANITGKCDNTTLEMNTTDVKLMWSNSTDYLEISFLRDDAKKTFNITQLTLVQNTTGSAFINSTMNKRMTFVSNGSGLFAVEYVPVGSSYKCSHKVNINMTDSENAKSDDALLTFSKVQIQAFMNGTANAGFGSVLECPGLDASDIVPIAVGCALAGLVIGVLIAYLVGRRRSHARGYLSM
ncbi:hypothetical protein J437_LFUL018213 [Ladona fulva]|uniref:Lysosome-associated membrane glycoprotein 5 n=1 Tax=Ladona fulva TaxID=123851 RepID=A0A8K0KNX4_LADFU|nr:hypothetical protein J437_LFUL018213 [Ladona fulva]